jgi:hypothetical protein
MMKLGSCSISIALLFSHFPTLTLAFHAVVVAHPASRPRRRATGGLGLRRMSTAAWENGSAPTVVLSTMKKQSKVLSVGLEYSGTTKLLSPSEISILSMQLRKSKVSAIVSHDIQSIREFATEQQSALGNFPGPCLVV